MHEVSVRGRLTSTVLPLSSLFQIVRELYRDALAIVLCCCEVDPMLSYNCWEALPADHSTYNIIFHVIILSNRSLILGARNKMINAGWNLLQYLSKFVALLKWQNLSQMAKRIKS